MDVQSFIPVGWAGITPLLGIDVIYFPFIDVPSQNDTAEDKSNRDIYIKVGTYLSAIDPSNRYVMDVLAHYRGTGNPYDLFLVSNNWMNADYVTLRGVYPYDLNTGEALIVIANTEHIKEQFTQYQDVVDVGTLRFIQIPISMNRETGLYDLYSNTFIRQVVDIDTSTDLSVFIILRP